MHRNVAWSVYKSDFKVRVDWQGIHESMHRRSFHLRHSTIKQERCFSANVLL